MIEFFETISSYIDKIITYFQTFWENITTGISNFKMYLSWLPVELIAAGLIIIVLLVIFRVLGR